MARATTPGRTQAAKATTSKASKKRANDRAALTASQVDEFESVGPPAKYTWEALRKAVGEASPEEQKTFAEAASVAELVKEGATVRSERLLTDGRRWLGQLWPYWSKLSAREKSQVVGFSDGRLRVTLSHFLTLLRALQTINKAPNHAAEHAKTVAEADARYRRGQWLRVQLVTALTESMRGNEAMLAALSAANTKATDAKQLARSLRNIVALAKSAIATESALAAQLRADGVTDEYLDRLVAVADQLEVDAEGGGVAGERPVSQTEIDRLDGLCIAAMRRMLRVFRVHQKVDPRVPTLVPIATRSVFKPKSLGNGSEEPEEGEDGESGEQKG
jgi:hypothetical protein